MNKLAVIVAFAALVQCLWAAPQTLKTDREAEIIKELSSNDGQGNFEYNFETQNGIRQEAVGNLKKIKVPRYSDARQLNVVGEDEVEAQVQSGRFSYLQPDGTIITVDWIADENGFQPIGDHLPVAPQV